MSIATQITRLNNNIEAMKNTKQQIKDAVNNDFDIIANEQIENYDTLIENGLELYKQYIPPVETNQATEIQVTDAMKCNSNKLEIFGNTSQDTLPTGYTALDYIESTGTQFIDLDYVIGSNTKLEIEYQTEKVRGNTLFGASNNNMNYYASGLAGGAAQTGQDSPTTIKVSTDLSTEKTSLLWKRAQVTYNGNVVAGNFGLDNSKLVLFKNQRWPNDLGKVKLYKFIAYNENIIVANYIPCKNGNNEVGLYDVVSNTFYGNSGTGDLVAGTDLGTIPSPDYPQDIHVFTGDNIIGVTGKNLLENNLSLTTINGITFRNKGDGSVSLNGTSTGVANRKIGSILIQTGKTYILSGSPVNSDASVRIDARPSGVGNQLYNDWTSVSGPYTATEDTTVDIHVRVAYGYNCDNIIVWPQVEEGSTATDYEPYYHQDYPINLGAENLFDGNNIKDGQKNWRLSQTGTYYGETGYFVSDWIKVHSNTEYAVNFTPSAYKRICFYSSNSDSTFISRNDTDATFTTPDNTEYVRFCALLTEAETIKFGNTSFIELCKIGNYQDYLYKENGNWYNYGAIGKVVLNGTEDDWAVDSSSKLCSVPISDVKDYAGITSIVEGYCNYCCAGSVVSARENTNQFASFYKRLFFNNQGMTLEEYKTYIGTYNLIVYYVLDTPTITQITDTTLISQLEAIYNHLALVKGVNHITITPSDLEPYMKLSYKNYELTSNE